MTEAVREMLNFGFKKIKLNKIFTGVIIQNKVSAQILKKFGFKQDGINRKHYFIRKRYYDEIILSLLRQEYKK